MKSGGNGACRVPKLTKIIAMCKVFGVNRLNVVEMYGE